MKLYLEGVECWTWSLRKYTSYLPCKKESRKIIL